MKRLLVGCALLLLGGAGYVAWAGFPGLGPAPSRAAAPAGEPMVAHMVYFSLKDNSAAAKAKLVTACKKYLSQHPGTVFFAAGTLAEEFNRPVNDRDFDVALHLVFKDKAAHDRYQDARDHLRFIEENKDSWKKVRVFDSWVEPTKAE
jgi:hypothetical protein